MGTNNFLMLFCFVVFIVVPSVANAQLETLDDVTLVKNSDLSKSLVSGKKSSTNIIYQQDGIAPCHLGEHNEFLSEKRKDVDFVMSTAKGRVQQAFKHALEETPELAGKTSIRICISPQGDVTHASIESSDLNSRVLENQILAIVKELNFASGNFDVYEGRYTFQLVGF